MTSLATRICRSLLVVAAAFGSASAGAATYNVSLFEGATGTGSGSFTFTNPGNVGGFPATVSLSTNPTSSAGARTFNPGTLNVQVAAVNFSDGKTPPNQISGNFVEGLTGTLSTTPQAGQFGCQPNQDCFFRITFSFTPNANPNSALKTYTIDVVRQQGNQVVSTPVPAGTYAVSNTATIPEPGILALVVVGIATLALWRRLRERSHSAA